MPRAFPISQKLSVVHVAGLVPPCACPDAHVLLWTLDGRRHPDFLRWVWHPVTGNFAAGVVHRHADLIRVCDPAFEFFAWLRGFRFHREKVVAIRTYHWPLDVYDEFDADLDRRVVEAVTGLLRPHLPQDRFHSGVDNHWLLNRFARYSTSW